MTDLILLFLISTLVALVMKRVHRIHFRSTLSRFVYIAAVGMAIYAPYYKLFLEGSFEFYIVTLDFHESLWVSFLSLGFMILISRYLPVK